jgi:hypothetical protein
MYLHVNTPLNTTGYGDAMTAADAEKSRIIGSGRSDMTLSSPSINLFSHGIINGCFSVRSAINKELIFKSHHKLH